jgi:hypothetical protein
MQTFSATGQRVSDQNAETVPNRIPGNPAKEFRYKHAPLDWEARLDDSGKLAMIPRLKHGYLAAGLDGTRSLSPGGVANVLTKWSLEGKVIPLSAPVLTTDPATGKLVKSVGYLQKFPAAGGPNRWHYADVWTHPVLLGGKRVDWTTRTDTAGWHATLSLWGKSGLLCPINDTVYAWCKSLAENRLRRAKSENDQAYYGALIDALETAAAGDAIAASEAAPGGRILTERTGADPGEED